MNAAYRERQEEQLRRYLEWAKAQGTDELPTKLTTLMRPGQLDRISWLRAHAQGQILEVGCNWGFVLASVGGHVGVDKAKWNIALARILSPDLEFYVGDACLLPFPDSSFDTVMLPEVLEHIDYENDVPRALREAQRVTRGLVLVTIPDGRTNGGEASSFKHRWLCDTERQVSLLTMLPPYSHLEYVSGFVCILSRKS